MFLVPFLPFIVFSPVTERIHLWNPPKDVIEFTNCDVPCYISKNLPLAGSKTVYDNNGKKSTFMHTMEGGKHYQKTLTKGTNDALSTTSFQSEVPLPYFSWAEYNIQSEQVDFDSAIKGAVFIARNCGSFNDREGLVKKLSEHIRVDRISSCLNNKPWPSDVSRDNKNGAMRKYLFYLSFENESTDDYITEKLFGGLESGSLPVFYGASNVKEHVPEGSIIEINHDTVDEVGKLLKSLMENKEEYDKYHEWRTKPLPKWFIDKYSFTKVHGACRACRWNIYNHNKHKYTWDHKNQNIVSI